MPIAHGAHSTYSTAAMIAFEAGLLGIGVLLILWPARWVLPPSTTASCSVPQPVSSSASRTSRSRRSPASSAPAACSRSSARGWRSRSSRFRRSRSTPRARGLQDGEAVPVIAITGTAANISCIAGGIIVFGDPLPGDAFGIAVQGVALVMVIVASAGSRRRPCARPRPTRSLDHERRASVCASCTSTRVHHAVLTATIAVNAARRGLKRKACCVHARARARAPPWTLAKPARSAGTHPAPDSCAVGANHATAGTPSLRSPCELRRRRHSSERADERLAGAEDAAHDRPALDAEQRSAASEYVSPAT